MLNSLHSAIGLVAITGIAWLLSEDRRRARLRILLGGLSVQIALAVLLLKVPLINHLFVVLNYAVLTLQEAADAGTAFVFGFLGGGPLPFEETQPGASYVLAFRALPLIIVVSALSALLTYWRVLPLIVKAFSVVLERTLGIGGALGFGTAANVFVGMVEAPLFIRPFLRDLSRDELFVLMSAGMATIAGTVLVLYAAILGPHVPDAIGHLLVASLISAPAAITIAKLMVPGDGAHAMSQPVSPPQAHGAMDAITKGTQDGLSLLLNVAAMLLALVALVQLLNGLLAYIPPLWEAPITLERLVGFALAPLTWLMGVPWSEATTAGALMGTKLVLNEFLAYIQLTNLPVDALSERSRLIMLYALCGFANFGSLGIMVGGFVTMCPDRRAEILALAPKTLISGTLATCSTGAVVGIL
jgi:CNT family concentrative nucleoside transporter